MSASPLSAPPGFPPDATRAPVPEYETPVPQYDGTAPFPSDAPAPTRTGGERLYVTVTAVIVVLPFLALGLAGRLMWGRLIHPADVLLALVLYTVTGLGVTVGFHRGLTHGRLGRHAPPPSRLHRPAR